VRINISGLSDRTSGEALLIQLQALEARAIKLEKDLHKTLSARGGIQVKDSPRIHTKDTKKE
jgi:hypothetical protein